MKSLLGKDLTTDQVKEVEIEFKQAKRLREALIKSLKDKIEQSYGELESDKFFNSPNWDKLVLNKTAYIKACKDFISLLS